MSDSILKLIPNSPTFMPNEVSQRRAKVIIDMLFPLAKSVNFEQSNKPQFVDSGTNWESIICPNCVAIIDQMWWKEAMDTASEYKFMELDIVVPCCNSKTTLHDLIYEWPVGFAQFRIEIVNPNRHISEEELNEIETVLDTKLRRIWAHY